jgi:capsular polysaccharide biosynthesis protein
VQHRSDVVTDVPRSAALTAPPDIASELKRNWKLVILPAIATMLIAWMIAALQPKRYRASAVAAVTPVRQGLEPNELLRSVEALDRRTVVATVAALATTPLTTSKALAAGNEGFSISTSVLPNTNLFRVDVEGGDPAAAADVANRVPPLLSAQTRAMFDVYGVTMVSAASPPTEPFAPRAGRAAAAGLVAGLIIGLALVYALHALRKRHAG